MEKPDTARRVTTPEVQNRPASPSPHPTEIGHRLARRRTSRHQTPPPECPPPSPRPALIGRREGEKKARHDRGPYQPGNHNPPRADRRFPLTQSPGVHHAPVPLPKTPPTSKPRRRAVVESTTFLGGRSSSPLQGPPRCSSLPPTKPLVTPIPPWPSASPPPPPPSAPRPPPPPRPPAAGRGPAAPSSRTRRPRQLARAWASASPPRPLGSRRSAPYRSLLLGFGSRGRLETQIEMVRRTGCC